MVLTPSTMLPLSTAAPGFQLPDVISGKTISLETFADKKALLIMFICQHCPFVKHIQQELAQLGKDYAESSLGIVAISANDAAKYPEDGPEGLKKMAQGLGFSFNWFTGVNSMIAVREIISPSMAKIFARRSIAFLGINPSARRKNRALAATLSGNRATGQTIFLGKGWRDRFRFRANDWDN